MLLAATDWPDPLTVFYIGITVMVAVNVVANQWRKVRQAEYRAIQIEAEAKLKTEMVQRGMTADEIERVIRSSKDGHDSVHSHHTGHCGAGK